jgi:hypothetical protein
MVTGQENWATSATEIKLTLNVAVGAFDWKYGVTGAGA